MRAVNWSSTGGKFLLCSEVSRYQLLKRYFSGGIITPIGGNQISYQSTLFKKLKHYGLHDETERLGLTRELITVKRTVSFDQMKKEIL